MMCLPQLSPHRVARLVALGLCALALGCAKRTPATGPNAADRDRLQGVWVAERIDAGLPPEKTARELEDAKKGRFRVEGDTLTITGPDVPETYAITLDATANPKVLTTRQPATATQHARVRRLIYKLEGDLLVLAFLEDLTDGVPPDFQPRRSSAPGEPSVAVIWLRKTDEPKPDPGKTKD